MPRRRSLTSQLYRAARESNNLRAASRGPGAYTKRLARRKVHFAATGGLRVVDRSLAGLARAR